MTSQLPLLETEKSFRYLYPEPVSAVVTRLRILSPSGGGHRVVSQELTVSPAPASVGSSRDRFGNEVREFQHERVDEVLEFNLQQLTECPKTSAAKPSARLSPSVAGSLNSYSRLVDTCDELQLVAADSAVILGEEERFIDLGRWVNRSMRFQSGVTGVCTTASEALGGGAGVCQDFSHILLSLCCAAGITARYVSGFVPGEGHMHAWVEALVPGSTSSEPTWFGFDPTHNRAVDYRYLRVAVGRDYSDISPITGSFRGSRPGKLSSWASHRVRSASDQLGPIVTRRILGCTASTA